MSKMFCGKCGDLVEDGSVKKECSCGKPKAGTPFKTSRAEAEDIQREVYGSQRGGKTQRDRAPINDHRDDAAAYYARVNEIHEEAFRRTYGVDWNWKAYDESTKTPPPPQYQNCKCDPGKPWTFSEEEDLQKAAKKFPVGTVVWLLATPKEETSHLVGCRGVITMPMQRSENSVMCEVSFEYIRPGFRRSTHYRVFCSPAMLSTQDPQRQAYDERKQRYIPPTWRATIDGRQRVKGFRPDLYASPEAQEAARLDKIRMEAHTENVMRGVAKAMPLGLPAPNPEEYSDPYGDALQDWDSTNGFDQLKSRLFRHTVWQREIDIVWVVDLEEKEELCLPAPTTKS